MLRSEAKQLLYDNILLNADKIETGETVRCLSPRCTYFYFILIVYVIFGDVKDKNKSCMSFERIEIPPPNMTRINIDEFYKSREWEYYEIDYNYGRNVYF